MAARHISSRMLLSRLKAGASSMTFWRRRWREHGHGVLDRLDGPVAVGRHRHPRRPRQPLGLDLVAQGAHGLDAGADELDLAAPADLGEVRVLGQEAVSGVYGLDVGQLGGGDDPGDVQVAFGRGARADADAVLCQVQPAGVAVGLAEDRHRLDPQLPAGADDAQGNLAAVCHQDA